MTPQRESLNDESTELLDKLIKQHLAAGKHPSSIVCRAYHHFCSAFADGRSSRTSGLGNRRAMVTA